MERQSEEAGVPSDADSGAAVFVPTQGEQGDVVEREAGPGVVV